MSQQIEMFDGNEPTLEGLAYEELQKQYSSLVRVAPEPTLTRSQLIEAILDPATEQKRLSEHTPEEKAEEVYKRIFSIYPHSLSPEEIIRAIQAPERHLQKLREEHREEDLEDIRRTYHRN